MKKGCRKIIFFISLLFTVYSLLFALALPVQAQDVNNLMENLIAPTPLIRADLIKLIFTVIQYVLSFLGVVAVLILIYGGFLWMTARGDEERVRKAKKVLINGLIGLIIILLSYAIVSFVSGKFKEIAEGPPPCDPGQCCGSCSRCSGDNTCSVYDANCPPCSPPTGQPFVVRWTYPEDGQENISLCALIQAGFNAELDENYVNAETVKITIRDGRGAGENCRENKECKSARCVDNLCQGETIAGTFTVRKDVFKFDNENDFEEEIWYRLLITTGVRSRDGRSLSAQRRVDFKTGTENDTVPPTVEQTYPGSNQENVCLLDPIQVIFSEPMDATTLLNEQNSYTNPAHQFNRSIPNVRTLNASPRSPYQKNTDYQSTLRAGPLEPPRDGIADICGNLLDGDRDGQEDGSPIDDYVWRFKTGETLYCDPIIDSLIPNTGFYNDEITLSGNYFKLSGELVFNRQVYVDNLCFDQNNFPRQACLVSWQNNEIKVKVPAKGGVSEGAISGLVFVRVGGRESNGKNFTLASPYLSLFTPLTGGRGQALTIRGERFGSYKEKESKVYFINENTLERIEGNLICEEVGWKDYEIVVAVPEMIPLGNYLLQIKRQDGRYSNVRSQTFEVTDDIPGPILCDITPYCPGTSLRGGRGGEEKTLFGDRFGDEAGEVFFNNFEAEIISWSNQSISSTVPAIQAGTYQVKIQDSAGKESNPLSFVSPCLPRGGLGVACFLDENTCTTERCLSPYECVSGTNGGLECRCCCSPAIPDSCPVGLTCDSEQICFRNRLTGAEVKGVCCGCENSEQCSQNEICKKKGTGPNCCYACEIGDEGQACKGGQCCSEDCDKFTNQGQTECERHDGCSWSGGACTGTHPYCCSGGRCVKNPLTDKHECRTFCGNGQIDRGEQCDPGASDAECREFNNSTDCNKYEGCYWTTAGVCEPKVDLDGQDCVSQGWESGILGCGSDCKFDFTNCVGPPGSGYWGETCRREDIPELNCLSGKKDCLNALGADCVKNIDAVCACCCRPDTPVECAEHNNRDDCNKDFRCEWDIEGSVCKSKGDSCDLINPKLSCDTNQACGESGQKGLCCGCTTDEDCNNGQGFACKKGCCYQFPPPKELKVISAEKDKIRLKWEYEDKNQLATHFEVWKKDHDETNFTLLTTCEKEDADSDGIPQECDPNSQFVLKNPSANLYELEDRRGNFEKGKEYSYKVRAKKGSQTAYSSFTEPATGKVTGIVSCRVNLNCPDEAPCCRIDTKICVDWENCQGNCQIGDKCQAPAIKFATHDFWVTEEEKGPCLIKVTPNRGYSCEPDLANDTDLVVLSGLNFKQRGVNEAVFFNGAAGKQFENEKEACDGCDGCNYQLWQDKEIKIQYTPAAEAQTGLVKVKKIVNGKELWSNGRTFTVLRRVAGPGSACLKDIDGCRRGGGVCDPVEVYPCTECDCSQYNQTECLNHFPYCEWSNVNNKCENIICEEIINQTECQKYSIPDEPYCQWKPWKKCITNKAHCRCCCDPGLRGQNDPCKKLKDNLECYANQDPCTGANRGLCCGCTKDADCNISGNAYGCDQGTPRCCRPRPIWQSTSFCDDIGPTNVRLNTAITLNFNQKMDFGSLNNDNLKVSRLGSCTDVNEGITLKLAPDVERCYLFGTITNRNRNNEQEKTETVFLPRLCKLKTNTLYKIEIVVGENGQGVRSEEGVAMNFPEGPCSWQETKNCQFEEFTTTADPEALCEIRWIDVQPRGPVVVRDLNISVNYDGYARDSVNKAVCVDEFSWRSSDSKVAVVTTRGRSTTATSKGLGTAKIIATIPILNKTCDTLPHTCGLLKVTLAGPQVIEQQSCQICNLGGQSPSPWKFSDNACLKAQIVARFDREMNQNSFNEDNIKVRQCQGITFTEPKCEEGVEIEGIIYPQGDKKGFYFKPTNLLIQEKIYQVTLKSGPSGLRDKNGLELDGNKNSIQDGSPADDYLWLFKTSASADCPLDKVCVEPQEAKICKPGANDCPDKQDYFGQIYTANCNYLEPRDYEWSWQSNYLPDWEPPVATIKQMVQGRSDWATATAENLGLTYIEATAQGKKDQGKLIVATEPRVEKSYPSGSGLCRNTAIWALFDQEMKEDSFLNNFAVFEGTNNVTPDFSLRFTKENKKTKVYFVPKSFLREKTTYRVVIWGEGGIIPNLGVESIPPFERKMANDYEWTFATGSYICRLERVEIEPVTYTFNRAKNTKELLVKTYYQNQEIQEVPTWYEWDWNWRSTDPTIVTITNSDYHLQTAESQPKNGLVNIIARATISVDKIFIPSTVDQFKEGTSRVEVWLCENPWPSTKFPEGEVYEDTLTNFSFRYCRDAGPAGLEGDLPILKGGKITGPIEPGLEKLAEHFFTVYDGSLSFLYDGESILNLVKPPMTIVPNRSGYNNSQNYNTFGDNNAIVSGNISLASGKFRNALSFAGNSYLKVNLGGVPHGRNITIEPEKFTLETWINTRKPSSPSTQYIFRKGEEVGIPDQDRGYGLEIKDDGKIYFWIFDKKGKKAEASAELFASKGTPEGTLGTPIPQEWTHLAASYDGKKLKIYINGESKEAWTAVSLNGGISQSNENLLIGLNFTGLLDEIALWQKVLSQEEIRAHLKKQISPTLGDVLGFKVFTNFEHLKPDEWYKKYAPGILGSGSYALVDGYKGYQVGRTLYVGATNVDLADLAEPKIYTNTYLVSQSDNPKPETSQVFRQSINNWKFNINLPDSEPLTPQNENKEKITRDLERIYHLREIWQTLEAYRGQNTKEPGLYPRIESGSYIIGMSTSKWPSWTPATGLGQDLVRAGLSPLPTDPLNQFSKRNNCGQPPTQYSCCADCPRKDPQCTQTCYNPTTFKYEGINPCHIYQYIVEGNPLGWAYGLYTNFEYSMADNWQHKCEGLTSVACRKRAFCHWKESLGIPVSYQSNKFKMAQVGELPGECKKKTLNYIGNPCDNLNMECACFNTKFSSIYVSPPPPPPQIITFNANPPQVPQGGSTLLTWETRNATSCTASGHSQWQGSVHLSGNREITNLQETTNFSLECQGAGGSAQASVRVDVYTMPPSYTLTVSKAGTGSGKVNFNPPDPNNREILPHLKTYFSGTLVTLTAYPETGSTFAGWSGCTSSSGNTCNLIMNSNKNVTATFNLIYFGYTYVANDYSSSWPYHIVNTRISDGGATYITLPNGSDDTPAAICITPDKRFVYVTDDRDDYENLFVIQTSNNSLIQTISTSEFDCQGPESCAVTPNGQYLIVGCGGASDKVLRYNINPDGHLSSRTSLTHADFKEPKDVTISPDSQYAYFTLIGGAGKELIKVNLNNGTMSSYDYSPYGYHSLNGIAIDNRNRLYISDKDTDKILIFDANNLNSILSVIDTCDAPLPIAVSQDNQYLSVGCPGIESDLVVRFTIIDNPPYLTSSVFCPIPPAKISDAYDLVMTPDNLTIVTDKSPDKLWKITWGGSPCETSISNYINNPRGVCLR